MVKFVLPIAALVALVSTANALPVPSSSWPASKGTVTLKEPQVVKAGTTFDGGMKTYDLANVKCTDQTETSNDTMVFLVEPGATLKNVIIGKNQAEGVHCEKHDCTIENVWWTDVCEDALSIKGGSASSVSKVIGGGARYAEDKIVQHNGPGTVTIDGFFAQDFGKLYRSCGTCGNVKRKVIVSNVLAINPEASIVTVNKNFGDEAKLSGIHVQSTNSTVVVCGWSEGVAKGQGEPTLLGDGPSPPLCQYSNSDVVLNSKASAGNSTASAGNSTATDAPATSDAEEYPAPVPASADSEVDAAAATEAPADDGEDCDNEYPAPASDDGEDDATAATEAPTDGGDDEYPAPVPASDDGEDDATAATEAPADDEYATPVPASDDGEDDVPAATDAPADDGDDEYATPVPASDDGENDATAATEAPADDEYATPVPASDDGEDDTAVTTEAPSDDDETVATPAPASSDDNDAKTPKPSKAPKTPKPSKAPKTPKPSKAPKTPKPSKAPKTPKPSKAPKTPKPSKAPKTPKPSKAPKTPKPTKDSADDEE